MKKIFTSNHFVFLFIGTIGLLTACQSKEQQKANTLFTQFFKAHPMVETEDLEWKKLVTVYQQGNYEDALKRLKVMAEGNPKNAAISFYLGNTYLSLLESKKAITAFQKIYEYPNDWQEKTNWYLGLAYLKNGELEKAQRLFWNIAREKEGFHKFDARMLVNKLSNKVGSYEAQ